MKRVTQFLTLRAPHMFTIIIMDTQSMKNKKVTCKDKIRKEIKEEHFFK